MIYEIQYSASRVKVRSTKGRAVVYITEAEHAPWTENPGPRAGLILRKKLATGPVGTADNFEWGWLKFHKGYTTPRHRHNFEQMRFALTGAMTYEPRKYMSPDSITYFPEGAHYGPQSADEDSEVLVLQYGGASGQPYMAQEEMFEETAELGKTGEFKNGIYTAHRPDGSTKNQDAYEACYEHLFHQKPVYVKPRITDPVKMVLEAHTWVGTEVPGVEEKVLGVFTERKAAARVLRTPHGGHVSFSAPRRVLLFSLTGDMTIDGKSYGLHTAVYNEGEQLDIDGAAGWEALVIDLPAAGSGAAGSGTTQEAA